MKPLDRRDHQHIDLHIDDVHIYHHFDHEQGQDARLAEIKNLLVQLKTQGDSIVATLQEFEAALARVDVATTQIGAGIAALLAQLEAGGLTDAQEAAILNEIGLRAGLLEGIAASVTNPVPTPIPPVAPVTPTP